MSVLADVKSGKVKEGTEFHKRLMTLLSERTLQNEKTGARFAQKLSKKKNPVYFAQRYG